MPVHPNGYPDIETEPLHHAIRHIEHGLGHDDPAFVRGFHRQARAERSTSILVVGLLVTTALLLAAGLATRTWPASVAGASAFIGAFVVHHCDRRRFARLSLQH